MLINSKLEWKASYDRAVTKSARNTHLMLIVETHFPPPMKAAVRSDMC